MKAVVVYADNPFAPTQRRVRHLRHRSTVSRLAPRGVRPTLALLNGRPVLRAHQGWQRTRLQDGDQLLFVTLPQGGGGGGGAGGGSNPLQALLTIALFAVAPQLATVLTHASAGFLFSATTAAIQLAGATLINAALAPPKPETAATASPTYSLQAQGNVARIEGAIPVQYGRLLAYPDLAAQPYQEYAGEDQYLYQLLCLGCGEFELEEIRIEDTPITAFEEIIWEVVPPGGNVTLFPSAVTTSVEVSGQELLGLTPGTWVRSGSVITVTLAAHGFAVGMAKHLNFTSGGAVSDVYAITGVSTDTFTVTAPLAGTSGAVSIHAVLGGVDGFVASASGEIAYKIGIDFILPIGLYHRDSGGSLSARSANYLVQARQVDDLGAPIGPWMTLDNGVITARTVTPLRRSMRYDLATPGRYRVRMWRSNDRGSTTDNGDQLLWGGLRSYMAEPTNRGPVTLIALRMRATNNLSLQSSRRIGVISTRKVPVWNGSSWSAPVASRSIAWAIADAARNTTYGAGLADARIDLAALLALDALWASRGDTFNARFDNASSWWEAVQKIASAGRAKCFMQGGILRVVRHGPQTVPVALFSMRNIKAGSFSIDYLMPTAATSDAVTATYWDASTWGPQRVTGKVPGSSALKPAKVTFFGVDNRPQALRDATYHAAANRYNRRVVRFTTEMEGFIPAIGDLIAVQHDMPAWGAHAEAVAWHPATRVLTLSEPMTFIGSSVIGLRRADGSISGPWPVTAGADAYSVVLTSTPDITPEVGGQTGERTHIAFGTASTWATKAVVTDVQPRTLYEVEIEAVTEDPSVHTAETGVVAPPIRTSNLPKRVTKPVVKGLFARRIPGDNTRAVFGWRPAPGAEIYNLEMAEGSDVSDPDTGWTRAADTASTQQIAPLMYTARTMVRVRASGLAVGPWIAATIGTLIPDAWNSDDTPAWTADTNPAWSS